jgi:hypothetical protein
MGSGVRASAVLAAIVLTLAGRAQAQAFDDGRCALIPSTPIPAGTNPYSVAIGDLNGDGKPDIAVANEGSNDVSILLGLGGGAFASATSFSAGTAPHSVAIADVSDDGKLDMIVANSGSSTITLRFGTGSGGFGSPVAVAVEPGPQALAFADLNGDGKQDLVVANGSGNSVFVLIGTGGGAFAAAVPYAVGVSPVSIAVEDFNDDAKLDLAVTNEGSGTVSVLLGNGSGAFGAATDLSVGSQPRSVVTGDFDADGAPDLAVANWNSGTVSILLGSPEGSFASAVDYPASALPTSLALADFGGDGRSDLVVANETSFPNIITILEGEAAGTFGAPTPIALGGVRPRGVAMRDLDANGVPDAVVGNYTTGDVTVLLGRCEPLVSVSPHVGIDRTSSYELRKSPVWFDRTTFEFYTHVAVAADLDRDGWTDVVRVSIDPSGARSPIRVLKNAGADVFVDETDAVVTDPGPGLVYPRKGLTGDFNSDGWPDVLILGHGLDAPPFPGEFMQLFLSNSDGTVGYSPVLESVDIGYHHGGASADIDSNGTIDVLTDDATGGSGPYFLVGDGHGNFVRSDYRAPPELHGLFTYELLDIDLDGYIDMICGGNQFTEVDTPVTIYWGGNTGIYRASASTIVPKPAGNGGALDFAAEDIDGDGDRDLIVDRVRDYYTPDGRYIQILRQVAPRQFVDETASRMTMNVDQPGIDFIRVQDIDGNGSVDIFVDNKGLAMVGEYAWTNDGHGVFAPYQGVVRPSIAIFANGFE